MSFARKLKIILSEINPFHKDKYECFLSNVEFGEDTLK
jgi:hypothetical protein